jgi:hypothetical protein
MFLEHPGPGSAFVVLCNNGNGAAFDVDVTISYEPGGARVRWNAAVMPVGNREQFIPAGGELSMEKIVEFAEITVTGQCRDALGEIHSIREIINPREYWDVRAAANHVWRRDPVETMARDLEEIRKSVQRIEKK